MFAPEIKVVNFDVVDVITTSGGCEYDFKLYPEPCI